MAEQSDSTNIDNAASSSAALQLSDSAIKGETAAATASNPLEAARSSTGSSATSSTSLSASTSTNGDGVPATAASSVNNDPPESVGGKSSSADDSKATSKEDSDKADGKVDKKGKSKGKAKAKAKEEPEKHVIFDTPGHRKEVRISSKGHKVTLETKGLWTSVHSNARTRSRKGLLYSIKKRLKEFKTFWPFLIKFAKQVIALGKWRFVIHLVASTITGLTPALRIYLSGRLITIAQNASEKRQLNKKELILIASTSYLSSWAEDWIETAIADNNGILQRRFEAMVTEHLIGARARLDVQTLNKARVQRDFSAAESLSNALRDENFVIGEAISLFTSAISLATQCSMVWGMTTKENADLALISVFSSSITLVRWLARGGMPYFYRAITDKNYNRMRLMEDMSYPDSETFGERKVLGLGDWVHKQYSKASNALGDVSLAAPQHLDLFRTTTEAIRSFSDTAILVLFSIKASERPLSDTALSMSSLAFIQSTTRGLAHSLYSFVSDFTHFGNDLSSFKSYYRILETKSRIIEPEKPIPYERQRIKMSSSSSLESLDGKEEKIKYGMEVEFRNVDFTWPGKKEKALDNISFKIEVGSLTAIVGYNGAGKSTIISLIARLCDPSAGQIFINGHDIKSYKTSDLHQAMSFLFQSSADLPLTIQEYIGVGNFEEMHNLPRVREAAERSGALEFIEKLDDGFQSTFTGLPENQTEDTMYDDAVGYIKDMERWAGVKDSDTEGSDTDSDAGSDHGDSSNDSDADAEDNADEAKATADSKDARASTNADGKAAVVTKKENDASTAVNEKTTLLDDKSADASKAKTTDSLTKRKASSKSKKKDNKKHKKSKSADASTEDESDSGGSSSISNSNSSSGSGSDSDTDNDSDDDGGRLAFSGGQRQKLILARSFIRNLADLAIFDEYSANLDPKAEHDLFQKITANRGKQTLLYITHRYSTLRHADKILMLEKGKVVESGTHEELMKLENGKYAEMARLALGEVDKEEAEQAAAAKDKNKETKTTFGENEHTAINTPLPLSRAPSPVPAA